MRVLYLNYIPSPYRIDFFNELHKHCNLTVLYYHRQIAERPHWIYQVENHVYPHDILFDSEQQLNLSGYFKLLRYLNNPMFDVIIVGGYAQPVEIFSVAWLKLVGRPFVLNTDGGFYQGSKPKLLLKKWLIRSANNYLASGSLAAETLIRYGASKEKIFNYHFTSLFSRQILSQPISDIERKKYRSMLKLPQDSFIILTIGRYVPLKGYELVIEALNHLKRTDIYLVMIGEGSMRDTYMEKIEKYGLQQQVFLAGEQSKDLVLQYCMAGNLMILPTLTSDVWGLVVNESMSCALPVIVSERVGAAYDMVIDGLTGYKVPVNDAEAISRSIIKIELNQEKIAYQALSMAKKYSIEKMVDDHLELFQHIVSQEND